MNGTKKKPMHRRSQEERDGLLERWRRSGQTSAVFARENNLPVTTLQGWILRAKKEESTEGEESIPGFTRVNLVDSFSAQESSPLRIETASGHTIHLGGDKVDLSLLQTILEMTSA